MKRLLGWIVITVIIMLMLLSGIIKNINSKDFKSRNLADYNDSIVSIYADFNAGKSVSEICEKYNCDIILSDDKDAVTKINTYYNQRAYVVDFVPNDEVIGKLVFNENVQVVDELKSQLIKSIIITWSFILVLIILFMVVIYAKFIKPINDFEKCATEIARGNMDVSIPVNRGLFGIKFTESFDLMREELKASKEKEAMVEKAQREMIAGLSHDIKTPVATIKANCELLDAQMKREYFNKEEGLAKITQEIGVIDAKTDTIEQLINNIFNATLEELEAIKVDVREENVEEVHKMILNMQDYGNIDIESIMPECLVYMDKLRMEQVINNIINNSIKYANTKIIIRYEYMEDGYIKIQIKDLGEGVPEDELAMITEKYYRGSNANGKQGSGLGLYLTRYFMDKMNGGMECYNDNGFVVDLYLKRV